MNSSDHALLITLAVLFGLALAASCGLGGCGGPAWGSTPAWQWQIRDAPARHSDGGQP